jgi:hypothetical protein
MTSPHFWLARESSATRILITACPISTHRFAWTDYEQPVLARRLGADPIGHHLPVRSQCPVLNFKGCAVANGSSRGVAQTPEHHVLGAVATNAGVK